jgi:hypothetical protein
MKGERVLAFMAGRARDVFSCDAKVADRGARCARAPEKPIASRTDDVFRMTKLSRRSFAPDGNRS